MRRITVVISSQSCRGFPSAFDRLAHSLFKKIGIAVDPLHFDVWTVFSSSMLVGILDVTSFGVLFVIVETFPPLLIRLLFGPTMLEKSTRGGEAVAFMA